MSNESRKAKRHRTNNTGILQVDGKEVIVLLRDASMTGVRVRLVNPCDVSDRVTLVSAMEKINAACTVVWRRGNDLGLKFES